MAFTALVTRGTDSLRKLSDLSFAIKAFRSSSLIDARKFFLASFGEKTIVNENEIKNSYKDAPLWTDLPVNPRIVLNGIVSINIFKT